MLLGKIRLLLDTFQRNYFAPRIVFCVADRTQGLVSYKKSKNIEGIRKNMQVNLNNGS